ncbi:MAG: DNRLRE domain-containing protein [Deltaproteobacteria bacterium]|nr:DNRLRE domain-containing protein [Deltaproteobacteria bacterium]
MKNTGFLLKVVVALAALPMLSMALANQSAAGVYAIHPAADAYVDSQHPDTNYGGDTQLYVVYAPDYLGSPLAQRSYLKFDLSVMPQGSTITSAKLYLYVTSNSGHPPPNTNLYQVGNDWTATGITWNSQPPTGKYLASKDFMFWGEYYAWNLFESGLWDPKQDISENTLSLMIRLANQTADYAGYSFNSSNSGTNIPYLEVNTADAVPAASLLLQ